MPQNIEITGRVDENINVFVASQYFENMGFDTESEEFNTEEHGYEDIQKILSVEVAYYLTRRVSGSDQYISDTLWELRRELITEYENRFDREFVDYNEGIEF